MSACNSGIAQATMCPAASCLTYKGLQLHVESLRPSASLSAAPALPAPQHYRIVRVQWVDAYGTHEVHASEVQLIDSGGICRTPSSGKTECYAQQVESDCQPLHGTIGGFDLGSATLNPTESYGPMVLCFIATQDGPLAWRPFVANENTPELQLKLG